jgi:Cyclic nucleotide-binding domain
MDGASATYAWRNVSEDFALFRTLSSEQRLKAFSAMVRQDLVRGQMLVAQGGPSDSLFMVLHGALAVRRTGDLEPIAELRAGELVGEIGFFANVPRTADARRRLSIYAVNFPLHIDRQVSGSGIRNQDCKAWHLRHAVAGRRSVVFPPAKCARWRLATVASALLIHASIS